MSSHNSGHVSRSVHCNNVGFGSRGFHQNRHVNSKKSHQKAQNLSNRMNSQSDRLERVKARLRSKLEERQTGLIPADPVINLIGIAILLNVQHA